MADAAQCAAEELLLQPSFCDALKAVEAALAARHEQQEPKLQVLPKEHADIVAQVAAEIAAQRRQQQEAIAAYTTAADAILEVLEQAGQQAAVPPALQPAVSSLLAFWHADAADASPSPQLSREVQLLLDPSSRAVITSHLTDLHQQATTNAPPCIIALPKEVLGEGVTPEMLPGGCTCRVLVDREKTLRMGGSAPTGDVPGLPGGPLNLQTLSFGLAVVERQVPGLHPLSLTMLDAAGERFVCCSVCGIVPCLEHAHVRLMSRKLADSLAERLAELEKEEGAAAKEGPAAA